MSTEPINLPIFNAVYTHGVDDKRRLQLPAKWRPKTEDFEFTLTVWPSATTGENCILALPPSSLSKLLQKFEGNYSDPQNESRRRFLSRNSDQVVLDKVGRFCIPEKLALAADIKKEAVLVGSWDRFEIWSPERYETAETQDNTLGAAGLKLI